MIKLTFLSKKIGSLRAEQVGKRAGEDVELYVCICVCIGGENVKVLRG